MKISNFSVLDRMSEIDSKSFKAFPASNITSCQTGKGKGFGSININVDNDTIIDLTLGRKKINVVLLVYDLDEFDRIKKCLKRKKHDDLPNLR